MKKSKNSGLYKNLVTAKNKFEIKMILNQYGITLKDLTAIQLQLLNKN